MIKYLFREVRRFCLDEDGVTAVEYAVLVAMILVGCIAAILNSGNVQAELWFETADSFNEAMPGSQL